MIVESEYDILINCAAAGGLASVDRMLAATCLLPEIFEVQYRVVNTLSKNQHSIITCPNCEGREVLEIPQGFSQHLYRCPACSAILKPKSGDCCIFCSFGHVDCSSPEQNLAA